MKKWKYNNPEFESDKLNYELLKFAPWSGHRNFVYDFMEFLNPKTVVELGSHYGCSAFTFAQAVKDFNLDTTMFFVDTWQGDDFTKKYDNDVYTVFSKTLKEFYGNQNINMLRMTFDDAVEKFDDKSVDLIHIDGSHYYDDVKRDFENWLPKVKDDGIIMLHDVSCDIVLGDVMGSYKYWLELKEIYDYTFDFDFSWGLGIIFLNKEKYEEFINSGLIKEKYQRINNALDVEFKDQLRKDYFALRDKKMYIDDLLKQKDTLNYHIEAYKKNNEEIKEKYEKEIEEIKLQYEKQISEITSAYEKNSSEVAKAYDNDKKETVNAYEKQIKEIVESYNETIKGKDCYIEELENIKEERDFFKEAYHNTINYKLKEMKKKIIK
ncbi:MAG: class I SAM-dependent methyltransferase [Lachnospirales bacterium]